MTALAYRPLGGRVVTKPFLILGIFLLIAAFFILRRFLFGMGDVSHMNNGYPLGTWVILDVVIGTAFGCGGFAMALVIYIFNKKEYHPLMRPALLGGLFGYTLAGLAVMIDLGRYWNAFNLLMPWHMNFNAVIFEVALCVMAYITVLWIEFSPAFLERMKPDIKQRYRLDRVHAFLKRYMYVFIALGVLLPMMHQSSLGTVLLMLGYKLSPLWNTLWLPFLFVTSALAMGFGVVMMEATIVQRAFKRPSEAALLGRSVALRRRPAGGVPGGALGGCGLSRPPRSGVRRRLERKSVPDRNRAVPRPSGDFPLAPPLHAALAVSGSDLSAGRRFAVSVQRLHAGRAARQWLDLFPVRAGAADHRRDHRSGNHVVSPVLQDPAGVG
jgi:hypothetical protein